MRYFKLVNAVGAEWDLMRKDGFFHSPSGLGFNKTINAQRAGDSWIISSEFLNQKYPSGEMVFKTYAAYREFASFIALDDPMYLMYRPENTWYRLLCKAQILEKGDMTAPGLLVCPVTFSALGTWSELVTTSSGNLAVTGGKIYSYTYPYTYANNLIATADVKNGNLESPMRIHIFGPVDTPTWALIRGGENISSGRANVSIPEGNKLVIDSRPGSMEIAEYTRDNVFVADRYASSDFSTARFIYAPPGDSKITVVGANGVSAEVAVELERVAYAV